MIGDPVATGTIENSDPLQTMWLSRFGRTVADHVTGAVSDRLSGPLTGAQVTVGGQSVDLARSKDEAWVGETLLSVARVLGAAEEPSPEDEGWLGAGSAFGSRRRSKARRRGPSRAASCCSGARSTSPGTVNPAVRAWRHGAG